jgi:predicted CoA-substrate-specific enzyme activase
MVVVGVDLGTVAAKAVVMRDGELLASETAAVRAQPEQIATDIVDRALAKAAMTSKNVNYSVSTGWGRKRVPFADAQMADMPCLAKGARWAVPTARTVVDIGGQSSRALKIGETGRVAEYSTNDKCAAGTGRLLELVTEALELRLEELASLASQSEEPAKISSQCCVFAESEVVTMLNEGRDLADIVAGVLDSIVRRLVSVVGTIPVEQDIVVAGGCAKNRRLVEGLENHLKIRVVTPDMNPQLVGALGAAVIAQDKLGAA